jgi:hypothetical protein
MPTKTKPSLPIRHTSPMTLASAGAVLRVRWSPPDDCIMPEIQAEPEPNAKVTVGCNLDDVIPW